MSSFKNFPSQMLPFNKKGKKWRKQVLDWADSKAFFNYNLVRNSVLHKKINYDLVNGIIHMEDIEQIINPDGINASFIPDKIQHYPIINTKLDVLRGEESRRLFDYKVIVTNPNAVSDIEENKKNQILQELQSLVSQDLPQEQYQAEIDKLEQYYTYEWQDFREIRANAILNHYVKELNMPKMFTEGFEDAMIVGEEIYQCDIVGGEPIIERLNPQKVRVFKSGYSNKIEDADLIILEDYWSPGRIIDTFYDSLTEKDIKYIENIPDHTSSASTDSMDNVDERVGMVNINMTDESIDIDNLFTSDSDMMQSSLMPYDLAGNIKVLRVFWKSKRKIKKVKSYDPETGEEIFNFFPENYKIDKDMGEEEEIFWINEAWEGTKIGKDIYINMRPRVVQYNRLSNPSRCHFGIVGSIYNINDAKPFSMVDRMKPYNYLYNAIHDRLNKLISHNWGKIIQLDLAKVPKGWEIEKWMYYARTNNIAVIDSFKEGNIGAATGKLAGALNNASSGVIDAEVGNVIQQNINLLEYIKGEMSDVVGISKQREGQIANRETVGGVERATLQSSHITEWLFITHEDVKKRALEVFLETAKIAMRGRSKKFQYILSDNSMQVMNIDGDEFAECDYGLVLDNGQASQKLNSQLDMLAQAALQNQALSFSSIMKLYGSASLSEKQKMIENEERQRMEQQQQQIQQQNELQQQQIQQQAQAKQAEMEQKERQNIRDNETKVLVAEIQAEAWDDWNDGVGEPDDANSKAELAEKMRQFDEKIKLDREKFEFEKVKHKEDNALKDKISIRQANRAQASTNKK